MTRQHEIYNIVQTLVRYYDIPIFQGIDKNENLGYVVWFIGAFGAVLSAIWHMSVQYYHQMLSKKYIVLLELEEDLEFHFFQKVWGLEFHFFEKAEGKEKDMPYVRLSVFETVIPRILWAIFFALMLGSIGFLIKKIFL